MRTHTISEHSPFPWERGKAPSLFNDWLKTFLHFRIHHHIADDKKQTGVGMRISIHIIRARMPTAHETITNLPIKSRHAIQ